MFEVNLVPELKNDAIKALKTRNLILFVCIVASILSVAVVLLLLAIKGGQDIAMASQDSKTETLSAKLNEFSDLSELLTIQDQLANLSAINDNKMAVSRIFGLLVIMQDSGQDEITFSSIDFTAETLTVSIEGQANALTTPYIDYRVLEEFRKNASLITYDYGDYVDSTGTTIPSYCLEDTDSNGDQYHSDYYNADYALWNFEEEGCNPSNLERDVILSYNVNPDTGTNPNESTTSESSDTTTDGTTSTSDATTDATTDTSTSTTEIVDDGTSQIAIFRTPLFNEWWSDGYLSLDGSISGVPHFESSCTTYSGTESNGSVSWTQNNDCLAVPTGITITESSNGTDESDGLVLRFAGEFVIDSEMFNYNNHFMTWSGPSGANVTDSFVQIADMFAKRAADCAADDETCNSATNAGGSEE